MDPYGIGFIEVGSIDMYKLFCNKCKKEIQKNEMMMIIDKFIQNNTLTNFKNYQILHKNTGRQTYNSKNKNEFLLLNNFKYIRL